VSRRTVAALLVAAVPIAAAGGAASAGSLDTQPTAVGVAEREFRLSPYRRTVPTGTLKFTVKNFGEDVHDLVVISPKGRRLGTTGLIRAGNQGVLRLKLKTPGIYRLVCTQGDHAARGMKSRIVVRATRR
jgi:plastocyanin